MHRIVLLALVGVATSVATPLCVKAEEQKPVPNSRDFRFEYGARITGLPEGGRIRIWLPVPPSNDHQTVRVLDRDLPTAGQLARDAKYGNLILYFEMLGPASGTVQFNTVYAIRRLEVRGLSLGPQGNPLTEAERRLFLAANKRVPLTGKQLTLLDDLADSRDRLALAHEIYDRVDEHVRYDKTQPGFGHGDVHWVCDSRFGNCTDFHSLFISLARAKGLPTRFEIGFPLPPERGEADIGGYHCWALFHHDLQGWVPVDISEADKHPDLKEYYFGNLTEDRVTFTIGRDIILAPKQDGEPLNYFIYPYVEVDSEAWPAEKINGRYRFRDGVW